MHPRGPTPVDSQSTCAVPAARRLQAKPHDVVVALRSTASGSVGETSGTSQAWSREPLPEPSGSPLRRAELTAIGRQAGGGCDPAALMSISGPSGGRLEGGVDQCAAVSCRHHLLDSSCLVVELLEQL